jgi:hypothetical protein
MHLQKLLTKKTLKHSTMGLVLYVLNPSSAMAARRSDDDVETVIGGNVGDEEDAILSQVANIHK